MLAEQPKNDDDQRPPLEGDSDVVRAIRDLSNDIRHLARRITRSNIPFLQGPAGPAERIKARKKAIGNARVTEGIAKAIAAEAELDDTQ